MKGFESLRGDSGLRLGGTWLVFAKGVSLSPRPSAEYVEVLREAPRSAGEQMLTGSQWRVPEVGGQQERSRRSEQPDFATVSYEREWEINVNYSPALP